MQRDKGNSFLRVFGILEFLAEAEAPRPTLDISEATDIPQPSVYRLCQMLEHEGFLVRNMDGNRFSPGPRMFNAARNILSGASIGIERRAILTRLVADVGETCNFAIPDKAFMVYADRVESSWPLQIQMGTGTAVPLHCTAVGKLYLSTLQSRKRNSVLNKLDLKRYTDKTICDKDQLEAELKTIRKQGYAVDRGEYLEEIVAASVPVLDPKGRFCGSVAIHAPESRLSLDQTLGHLPRLNEAARELENIYEEL